MQHKSTNKKIHPTVLVYDQQRQNANQEIESLLVSSVRYENPLQGMINYSHVTDLKKNKTQQMSLIKKQFKNNVIIDDQSYMGGQQKCECLKKIEGLSQNIKMISLKIQQFQSKLSLCFNKHAQNSSKISQQQTMGEEIKYLGWQNKQKLKELTNQITKKEEESKYRLKQVQEEINRLNKNMLKLQNKQNERQSIEGKMMDYKLEKYRDYQQQKINKIIETIQELGNLQRKMIDKPTKIDVQNKTTFPDEPATIATKKYYRGHSISQKYRTNESTNISYSRNYQLK